MDPRMALLVTLGSGIGGLARWLAAGWLTRGDFPTGTLLVNATGSFLLALLVFGGLAGGWLTPAQRVFLGVGVLGGFTTMSTFTYESVALAGDGAWTLSLGNVAATLAACLGGAWLGRAAGLTLWGGGA